MNVPPEVLLAVRSWVERAEEDFLAAEHLLAVGERCPFRVVGFHAQQCSEKYLKALLTLRSVPFPKTHDLTELLLLVPKDTGIGLAVSDVAGLNPYAVQLRYPGDWEPLRRPALEEAITKCRKVRGSVRRRPPKEALGTT